MGPAALLDYDRSKLRGLILEDGGALSHVAIVARSLGIPAVGNVANIINLAEEGDPVIVDGSTGDVYVRPTGDVENSYGEMARLRAKRQEQYRELKDVPCETTDGTAIDLHMNAGLVVDLQHVGGNRRALRRPVPHRDPVHGGAPLPAHARAGGAVPLDLRGGAGAPRDLPHPRYRLGQGPALHGQGRGGEPGPRLARHPHRPRSPGPAPLPAARHAARRWRSRLAHHVSDDRGDRGVPPGQDRSSSRR